MTNGRLFDTNVIIRIMKNIIPLPEWAQLDRNVFISEISVGELIFGAEKSIYNERNIYNALGFCSNYRSLDITREVAIKYGQIKAALQKAGTPIPENDLWIAATAIAFDLVVVTGDKHFERVPNLQVEFI